MMTWKFAFLIAIAALLVTNLFWAYRVIDDGVTVTHLRDSLNAQRSSLHALSALFPEFSPDIEREELLRTGQQLYPDSPDVFEKGSDVVIKGVTFSFSNNKLVGLSVD